MIPSSQLTAIVLAAGSSERMESQNKLLLDFRGKPLVAHIVETVVAGGLNEVVVVLGHESERVRSVLATFPVTFTRNDRYMEGMTSSIHAGVAASSKESNGLMICLSDLPLITPAELQQLGTAFEAAYEKNPNCIIVPYHEGQRGNPVIFSAVYRPEILAERGLLGCRRLVKQHQAHVVEVEMETDHILVDIDSPEAYAYLVG